MSKKITDELLYKYCKTVDEYITDKIPNGEEIDHTYSEEFENKIKKIIKQENKHNFVAKFYKYSKKVAIIFLIIISVFGATMSVDAIRYRVIEAIKHIHKEFTLFEFNGKSEKEFNMKLPTYLPEGFKETEKELMSNDIMLFFKNNNDGIFFECFKIENQHLSIDTEDAEVNKLIINGMYEAEYIKKGEEYTLMWQDEENCYIVTVETEDGYKSVLENKYDELIKIAESVR